MKNLHKVSDEEFDKLFQDKLYAYEAEPTDAVWAGILEHLPTKGKENSFPILRIAAASMAGMIGLGMWLAATKEPIKLSGTADPDHKTSTEIAKASVSAEKMEKKAPVIEFGTRTSIPQYEARVEKIVSVKRKSPKSFIAPEARTMNSDLSITGEEKAAATLASSRPDARETASMALVSEQPVDTITNELRHTRRKIKSIGSLVNYVVGKVDKRTVKIIEFEDGDEGTKVSGLNLGFMKITSKE